MPDLYSIIKLLILLIPVPFLTGGLFVPSGKGKYPGGVEDHLLFKLIHIYICGLLLQLTVFEIIALKDIPDQRSMTTLTKHYDAACLTAMVFGICRSLYVFFASRKKKEEKKTGMHMPRMQVLMWLVLFVLMGLQCYYFVNHQHLDGDDSYYVAQSLIADTTGDLYLRDPNTGYVGALDGRHAMAALPVFITWLGRHTGIHTTIIAHTCMAPFFLTLMYFVYILLGARLLRDKKEYIPVFVFLIGLWYINSNVSLFTAETFAYTRTWQGKAVFGNICVPLALTWLYDVFKGEKRSAIMLALTALVSVLATTASVFLLGILLGLAGAGLFLFTLIKEKNFKYAFGKAFPVAAGLFPLLIAGIIYIRL